MEKMISEGFGQVALAAPFFAMSLFFLLQLSRAVLAFLEKRKGEESATKHENTPAPTNGTADLASKLAFQQSIREFSSLLSKQTAILEELLRGMGRLENKVDARVGRA